MEMEPVRVRADCCNAMTQQTYFKGTAELYFCQHHADEHEPVLLASGWILRTEHTAQTIDNRTLVPVE